MFREAAGSRRRALLSVILVECCAQILNQPLIRMTDAPGGRRLAKNTARRPAREPSASAWPAGQILRSRPQAADLLALRRESRPEREDGPKARPSRKRRRAAAAPATPARPIGREWSREQVEAIDQVGRWLKAGEPQVFRLFGYAGVGKTTLARHVAEGARGETAFAAFTGKAALVMRANGCAGATTIHALIYRASEGAEGAPTFTLNEDGPASRAGLIVIDECSMVDAELARDLLSFGKPILVLGDPFQLPPVKGGGYFTESSPGHDADRRSIGRPRTIRSSDCRRSCAPAANLPEGVYGETRVVPPRARSTRPRCWRPIRCWSASTGRGAPTTSGCATQRLRGAAAGRRRPARLPAQRPDQGPDQRRPVAGRGAGRRCRRISSA